MEAIPLYRGVSIYQVDGSKNWYVRIWNHDKRRYVVKATGQTSAARAREFALSHALSLLKDEPLVDREFTFRHQMAEKLLRQHQLFGAGAVVRRDS